MDKEQYLARIIRLLRLIRSLYRLDASPVTSADPARSSHSVQDAERFLHGTRPMDNIAPASENMEAETQERDITPLLDQVAIGDHLPKATTIVFTGTTLWREGSVACEVTSSKPIQPRS